ncbi:hypothetical protein [Agrococcus jejuensis]|nr:hypothetical protein [Agrococcus jejuensis]
MRFAGVLPEDAPDPGVAAMAQARALPVPVRTLVAQPTLARIAHPSLMSTGEPPTAASVSWSYTLWRVPGAPDDPANLADLDDATRESLDAEPPWPRPAWLVASLEWMRRPMLWEAVRTTWDPPLVARAADPLADALRQHVAYVAVNRFDEARGPDARWDRPELEAASAWNPAEVLVDGVAVDGVRLDGDPHVLGLGAVLADGAILTAALPRAELAHVRVAFETVAW